MKSFLTFVCVLLACLCFGLFTYIADTEYQVRKWQVRVSESEQFERDIKHVADQFEAMKLYVEVLTHTVRDMAAENGTLCKRDAKMVETVAAYEEENRRLKESVKEAVAALQEQELKISKLIDENDSLRYKVQTLEAALTAIKQAEAKAKDEARSKQMLHGFSTGASYLGLVVKLVPVLF